MVSFLSFCFVMLSFILCACVCFVFYIPDWVLKKPAN